MRKKKKQIKAFSLIEILVSIFIFSLLFSFVSSFITYQSRLNRRLDALDEINRTIDRAVYLFRSGKDIDREHINGILIEITEEFNLTTPNSGKVYRFQCKKNNFSRAFFIHKN